MTRLFAETGKREKGKGKKQKSRDKDFLGDFCKRPAKNNPH